VPFERPERFGERATLTDEEYAAKVNANDEQIAKDQDPSLRASSRRRTRRRSMRRGTGSSGPTCRRARPRSSSIRRMAACRS
jgi:hypothetical protein